MNTTLDGQALFGEQDLQVVCDSVQRTSIVRSVSGLDGALSIDLGQQPRKIRQRGVLHAISNTAMHARLDAIDAFIDGRTHILVTTDGQEYPNVRMDAFNRDAMEVTGPGVAVQYEIVYTQLRS